MRKYRYLITIGTVLAIIVAVGGVAAQPLDITIGSLRGPTGVGMAPALVDQPIEGEHARVTVEVVPEPPVMVGRLASGEFDVGMLPSNVAAQLYNRGLPVQIAAVTLWGVLYVVGDDPAIDEWSDLTGRRVHAIARGAGPDIMLRHILSAEGVDATTDIELDYRYGHVELAQMVIAGTVDTAVLPEPFVTQVLSRRDDVDVLLDFQETWRELYGRSYPQTVVLVRSDVAAEHPDAIDEALAVVRDGWATVLADPEGAGRLVAQTDLGLPPAVVSASLPRLNAEYVSAADAQPRLDEYFRILHDAEPRSVGGSVPDDGIYRR